MKIYEYLEKVKRKEFLLNKFLNPYEDKLSILVNKKSRLDEQTTLSKFQNSILSFENNIPHYVPVLSLAKSLTTTHEKHINRWIPSLGGINNILQKNVLENLLES